MFKPTQSKTVYLSNNVIARMFLNDIRAIPQLSAKEQRALVKKAQKGDLESRDRLILCNARLVVSMAKSLGNADNYNDLVNEGVLGLNRAIEKFDTKRTTSFITYAVYWINYYMREYIAMKNPILAPKNNSCILKYVPKFRQKFMAENGREPTADEIMDMLLEKKMSLPPVESLEKIQMVSIDGNYSDIDKSKMFDFEKSLRDYDMKSSSNNVEGCLDNFDNKAIIKVLMSSLKDDEREIVRMRFGFDGHEMSFDEIASRMSVSTTTVRKKLDQATRKMATIAKNNNNKNKI